MTETPGLAVLQQDLSYLHEAEYAALMQSWLSAAVHLDANTSSQLQSYCAVKQPPDRDRRDMLLVYADHGQYQHYAQQLAPMLWDISVGVSVAFAANVKGQVLTWTGFTVVLVTHKPSCC